jgi:predicted O-methyltransferase YrrM
MDVPPLVDRAYEVADRLGFPRTWRGDAPSCSIPEVGRLLAVLAARTPAGRVAETGTGTGVGAAWLVSGLGPSGAVHTVELDPVRAAAARDDVFGDEPRVTVHEGDAWEVLAPLAPFDLVFLDGGRPPDVIELVAVGGVLVQDDLTPGFPIDGDPKRELVFRDSRWLAVEVLTTSTTSALVATRRA